MSNHFAPQDTCGPKSSEPFLTRNVKFVSGVAMPEVQHRRSLIIEKILRHLKPWDRPERPPPRPAGPPIQYDEAIVNLDEAGRCLSAGVLRNVRVCPCRNARTATA